MHITPSLKGISTVHNATNKNNEAKWRSSQQNNLKQNAYKLTTSKLFLFSVMLIINKIYL